MNVLITGAKGFVGRNLVAQLKNIRDGKEPPAPAGRDIQVFEYDLDTDPALLDGWCARADFVFHLAGVNRPKDPKEFMEGNFGFTSQLLNTLKRHRNACPIMISSSAQAELDNPYGVSKRAGEELVRRYALETGAKALIYRFPNLFGKWCRPNYNSVVATFCHNIARGLPITVNDPTAVLHLAYIDDVVSELIRALTGGEGRSGEFCKVPVTHSVALGRIAELIESFRAGRETRELPDLGDPFVKALHATYLSYLPEDQFAYPLKMNVDQRGSFTEILRTASSGQFSVNISRPGVTKGNHWHHSKNEKFVVVSGKGVIRLRKIGEEKICEYFVSGEKIEVLDIPAGYTHNIENLGDGDMVTFMWSNECFDPDHPDTFSEKV